MIWLFENDTSSIVNKLAKRSLKSEKRRNLMVVIAVALAAFLVCFTGIISVSLVQIQRNQEVDTYEAVFTGVTESDVKKLKGISEFARVGEYYLLGREHDRKGYHVSYVYCDSEMMYIARSQMELVKGRLPKQADEVAVSEYFLTVYGFDTEVGGTVRLESESFHGEYTVTGILGGGGEKETNTYAVVVSRAALEGWAGFDPAGYRAYVHFLNDRQMDQETMTARCREIADEHGLPPAGMNSNYFHAYSRSFDFTVAGSIAFLVLIGGYVVVQSIFRISVGDKVKSYGQLRTIGATAKQIRCVVKRESSLLGSIGILAGVLFGWYLRRIPFVSERLPSSLVWGCLFSDSIGLLDDGIFFGSHACKNCCWDYTDSGSTIFFGKGKDTQQEEAYEAFARIYGAGEFLARPKKNSQYCDFLKSGRHPSFDRGIHIPDKIAGTGGKIIFPGWGL